MVEKDTEKQFKVFNSFAQQTNNFCWTLDKPESTMSLGSTLTKIFPDLRILLLNGPLGAGKTTLVKGIAKSLKIQEPITSPTFPLSQHYPLGSPPLVHLDLYRIEEKNAANEFFLQEEEENPNFHLLLWSITRKMRVISMIQEKRWTDRYRNKNSNDSKT